MAKKKTTPSAKYNRSQLIREALDRGITSPKAITEYVYDTHGVEVSQGLAAMVKSKSKAAPIVTVATHKKEKPVAAANTPLSGLDQALLFVRAVGGLDNARKSLSLIEEIRQL